VGFFLLTLYISGDRWIYWSYWREMSGEQTRVRRNVRKFVECTTVRGISRVFKTESLVIRAIWILAVVACASMIVYQLHKVVAQFFKYEFSTVTKEDINSATVSKFVDTL